MRLLISKEYDPSFHEDYCSLKTSMLRQPSTHLFIAGNSWEAISIELDDCIPEACLCNLSLICDNVTIALPDVITDKTIRLLCELYPKKAGAIRRTYMCHGDLKEVLSDCLVR